MAPQVQPIRLHINSAATSKTAEALRSSILAMVASLQCPYPNQLNVAAPGIAITRSWPASIWRCVV